MCFPSISFRVVVILLTLQATRFASRAEEAPFPTPKNNQEITTPMLSPQQALAKMHLPPGFKATVFAGEPDVQQPIACCWDERGRLWIAENYTYSDGNERFDLKLRDRILIFEDADNDGRFDKRTVFADNLQMLTSIERGFGGVYAMCPPHLLFIPTKDDKPTGPPQILLDGFSTTAASRHTFANGLKWGPDGWLYGRIGISSTSWIDVPGTPQEKRQPTAGGVWRYHPTRKIYEPYCHGTTNPWGMDWDENGEMFFINTVIGHFWHGIRGAHFKRMHGEDPYPHLYGQIDQHADHYHWDTGEQWSDVRKLGVTETSSAKGGGHAHVGMMIYQGTNWPHEYRGKVFTLNLHGRRVNVDRIEREGSGYVAKHEPDMFQTDDPWFRGIEITYGPDGGVYILDWSDIGECHESDGVHRTSGRIYKITYGDPVKPKETDLTKLSDEELVKLHLSKNEWLVRNARWVLRERAWNARAADPQFVFRTSSLLMEVIMKQPGAAPIALPSASFLGIYLAQVREFGSVVTDKPIDLSRLPLKDRTVGSESTRAMLVRRAVVDRDPASVDRDFASDSQNTGLLQEFTQQEPSPLVRLAWASALQRLPNVARLNCAQGLLSHAEDATDHNLPLMYWFGLRDLPPAELVKLFPGCQIPLVRQFITRRVTEEIEKDPAPLNTLLGLASKASARELRADILTGMTAALKGWRSAKKPETWDAFAASLEGSADTPVRNPSESGAATKNPEADKSVRAPLSTLIRDLNVLFGDGRALDEVRAIALDDKADPEGRRSALRTLVEAKAPDARDLCLKFLSDRSFGLVAVQGLATFDEPDLAGKILARYKGFYPHERAAVIAALVSRASFAKVLLERMTKGEVPRADLTPIHARQIRSFKDESLNKKLSEAWGELRDSTEDKKKLIADLKAKLTPESIAKADQSQGRFLYASICASCHKLYGEGSTIGPDLTGSGRHDVNYLLENIIDPSALVAADFKMSVITLKDGRVLNGILHGQNDRTITVAMVGQEVTVDRTDIVKQEQLPVSMMPEGQMLALSDEQIRNLFAYLMGNSQVPLPSAQ